MQKLERSLANVASIFFFISGTVALICYESDREKGTIDTQNNILYRYCATVTNKDTMEVSYTGYQEDEDQLTKYDGLFSRDDPTYLIDHLCLDEIYDFRMFDKSSYPENFHRCVCNFDFCNDPAKYVPPRPTTKRNTFESNI